MRTRGFGASRAVQKLKKYASGLSNATVFVIIAIFALCERNTRGRVNFSRNSPSLDISTVAHRRVSRETSTVCTEMDVSITLATQLQAVPRGCDSLPNRWIHTVNHLATVAINESLSMIPSDTFYISHGDLYLLNPTNQKYFLYNKRSRTLTFTQRSALIVNTLVSLLDRFHFDEVLFKIDPSDVPQMVVPSAIPTLGFHGWQYGMMPFIREPSMIMHDLEKLTPWDQRVGKIFYSDGSPWISHMPGDTFPDARRQIRRMQRDHSEDMIISKTPIPFADWSKYKFVLYLDGIGPSERLPRLLQLGSVVFIPEIVIPSWPMVLVEPYVHYIPVHRNLSNLFAEVEKLRVNDTLARSIARASYELMTDVMSTSTRWCALALSVSTIGLLQAGEVNQRVTSCAMRTHA